MKQKTRILISLRLCAKLFTIGLIFVSLVFSCKQETPVDSTQKIVTAKKIAAPVFNSDSAYSYVGRQVSFGPRVPNTTAHESCAAYLVNKLKEYTPDVIVQEATLTAYDQSKLKSKNIIAQFNKANPNRVFLCSHWDSRPFADHDEDASYRDKPIDGACDGASGVGILLEIARLLAQTKPVIGVDIIFFDAEDYGQPDHKNLPPVEDSWCLGSQYWAKNPHVPDYYARYGILLDMVGAKNAMFTKEGTSLYYASPIVDKIWNTASQIGFSDYFLFEKSNPITDDHLYINQILNIPCADIIQNDPTTKSNFGAYWHTHNDKMNIIDKTTLKAVGQTVLEVVFNEK